MAVPLYDHDLTVISEMETVTGVSALGGGGAGLGAGVDFAIQGINCVDKQVSANSGTVQKGLIYDNGTPVTLAGADHIFLWIFASTPGLLEPLANGGKSATIGTSATAYHDYYLEGQDTRPEGGNKCYAIRYTATTPSPGLTTGTPGASPQWFGGQLNVNGISKGVNLGVDVMRYGIGAFITAGDATTPATFAGFAALNDANANRWGLLTKAGAGYVLQGRFTIGQTKVGVGEITYFKDSNTVITFTDTPHSTTTFSQFRVAAGLITVILTSVTFIGLGTHNPGVFIVEDITSTVTLTSCSFSSIGITSLNGGTTATGCTWSLSGGLTQEYGWVTDCVISNTTSSTSLVVTDLGRVTGTTFESPGTGHAMSFGPFVSSGTITSTDNRFINYATVDGITGNEVFYFEAVSGNITLNVVGGSGIPSIRTEGVVVTVVANPATTTVNVIDAITSSPILGARVYLVAAAGGDLAAGTPIIDKALTNSIGVIADTRAYTADQPVIGRVRKSSSGDNPIYKTSPISGTINKNSGLSVTIQMIPDE